VDAVSNAPDKWGQIIKHLEQALALADELGDGGTGFLIEQALDEARSRQFRLAGCLD
jgi:DNA-binding ferritin-like protein